MTANGKFCPECGFPKPADEDWICACGAVNKGKFCLECGAKKPAGAPLYQCDKCGWQPEDPKNPPRFCPECSVRLTKTTPNNARRSLLPMGEAGGFYHTILGGVQN